ncbi:MAG: adenosylcobinamide-GDP ribazoletransferase [Nitrospirota bacterium]|nr:adenosylcobinamide-GDP ribazoletransferase [Nitrospirota bacterium]
MKKLLLAIQFLTIIPIRVRGNISERDMVDSTVYFPVAGACQGLIMAMTAAGLSIFYNSEVVCGFVLFAHIMSNGGFDLDGLADTADAVSIKSSGHMARDMEKRLSVMKDSSIGASGAVAVIMSLLLKFVLLNNLFTLVTFPEFLAVVFMLPAYSKWVTVPAMLHANTARKDGLGKIFIDNVTIGHVAGSTMTLLMLSVIPFVALLHGGDYASHGSLVVLLLISQYAFCIAAVRFFRKRFGGLTGDSFGAMSEVSEILFLMMAGIWLRHSTL